jgi:short-subunit dehydrogenase
MIETKNAGPRTIDLNEIESKSAGLMKPENTRKLAVVTGASSGIGFELARVFAQNGFDLLVNSGSEKIESAAHNFESLGAQVTAVEADLSTYEGVEKLWQAIQDTGRPLDAIAINAGIGVGGDFARETNLDEELKMIQLNVTSVVHLTKRVLKQMVSRNQGRILVTSSIAAEMPAPLEAVYGATKAFELSFVNALRNELKDTEVTVTALQPGPTNTNFFHRAGLDNTEVGSKGKETNQPEEVARQGFEAMMSGKDQVYASSLKTKLQGEVAKFAPESLKAEQHRKQAEPKAVNE